MKRLVIIPARAGSKRIQNKNIKLFLKKPLIYYCLEQLKKTKLFSKIHVSSDSKRIINLVNKINIDSDFFRPKKLSGDHMPIWPVLKYVVERYSKIGMTFDQVWLVYATNPFISKQLIINCEKIFNKKISKSNNSALITVSEYNYPVEWAQKINKNGFLKPLNKKKLKVRSQDLSSVFCDAGMINIYSSDAFNNKIDNVNYIPFVIDYLKTVDIDNIKQFKAAEKIYKTIND